MLMLKDRVALVTGASRGIGRAIALKFAQEGATVYAGMRTVKPLDEETPEAEKSEGHIIPIELDVCSMESIKACVAEIKHTSKKLDILVNNAGLTIIERLEMASDASRDKIYETNVFGLLHMTQTAIRLLKKSDKPIIINMSSIEGESSDVGQTLYASSKAAVSSMTKTWAKEFTPLGFRVNAIAPGNVDTDMFNVIRDGELKKAIAKIGMGKLAQPEEIANVALFLASDMASYVSGEIVSVNGGLVL